MKKFLLFVGTVAVGIGVANAAVRDASSINRQSANPSGATTTNARNTTARTGTITTRTGATSVRTVTTARNTTTARTTKNTAQTNTARGATPQKNVRTSRNTTSTTATPIISRAARNTTAARAAATSTAASNTFGTGYNTCRDAYFACMDQFCAKQNETYRRCVCSPKLATIQSRERQLTQTSDQLQDFKNLNIEVIQKTGAEVKAMISATEGEKIATNARDTSDSAKQLAGISEVLSNTKSKALSSQGTLDIAGDINSIWETTDFASGAQIANLTGEALYNAVHSQCTEIIADRCPSTSTLNMVISAYGMYIENDCASLLTALDKKYTAANAAIRQAESEMHTARLENYDAHNSTAINECIAQVRKDITSDTACGSDYIHCLDISGKYLNRDTGEPIYTADFYQLESSISLAGDILNNQTNQMIVTELNRKRTFAERGLETCRDLADDVWDEFMRQAITEIYQGQHKRIRQVKNECLDVVNQCYDTQNKSLKDFSNVKEQQLLGARMELSEEMCREKLNSCSNLYGGGANGMDELVAAMKAIIYQQIGQQCLATLRDYVKTMCSVPSNDSLHSSPFGCRTYKPGDQYHAAMCHVPDDKDDNVTDRNNLGGRPPSIGTQNTDGTYTSCRIGYYMTQNSTSTVPNSSVQRGNYCQPCTSYMDGTCDCPGGTDAPKCDQKSKCADYEGSLYQKLVRYAQQTCIRPSKSNEALPSDILQDVNVVMDDIRVDMARELAKECERLGGIWVNTQYDENSDATINDGNIHQKFYTETSASTRWGYCTPPDETISADKQGCESTGGTWENTTCTCPDGTSWNATDYKCEETPSET